MRDIFHLLGVVNPALLHKMKQLDDDKDTDGDNRNQMATVSLVAVITISIFIVIQLFHFVQQRRIDYAQPRKNSLPTIKSSDIRQENVRQVYPNVGFFCWQ
jgi:hypothetical protein